MTDKGGTIEAKSTETAKVMPFGHSKVSKKARQKLPKTELKMAQKSQKKAHSKLPMRKKIQGIFWTIGILAWTVLAIYLSNFVAFRVMIVVLGPEKAAEPMWEGTIFVLAYTLEILMTVIIPSIIIKKLKIGAKNSQEVIKTKERDDFHKTLGLNGWPTWTDIGLAPVGYIVYLSLAMGAVALLSNFQWFDTEQKQELVYETTVVGWDRIIAFISYVVVAPIAEETIFRGWLYAKLREKFSENLSKWGGMLLAIFLVSLVFALVHSTVVVGVCVFILSVILCVLREITGTIYSGILVHMIVNGVAFYMNYIAQM